MMQHICFLFPLTTVYLDFPSFTFNPVASGAVSKATNDVFMSFSDLSILCLYYQRIKVALRTLRSQRAINSNSRFCDMFNFRITP